MQSLSDIQPHKHCTGRNKSCILGMSAVGGVYIILALTSACVFPVCYMFFSQQTCVAVLYLVSGVVCYLASGETKSNSSKCGVCMTLILVSWVWTVYIWQVTLTLMTHSFFTDRDLEENECPYSRNSKETVLYYVYGSVALLFSLIYTVLSVFVFASFWRDGRSTRTLTELSFRTPITRQDQSLEHERRDLPPAYSVRLSDTTYPSHGPSSG